MYKKEKGVTLVILIIAVMILMIIAGVIIDSGLKSIRTAKLENLKTNMLLLQAKGKEYVENANFHIGTDGATDEQKTQIKSEYLKGSLLKSGLPSEINLTDKQEAYELSASDMQDMGLNDLSDTASDYIMIYDIENETVDVMYKPGIARDNKKFYTLSSIEKAGI